MALGGKGLALAIPDTVLEEKGSLRDKTTKLGLIARACGIYGVDVIEIFRDRLGKGEGSEIRKVLEYLETPQYLRRRIYPFDEALRYAGVLPPLRIPSHRAKVPLGRIKVGDVREGVVNSDGTVDVGLDAPPRLKGEAAPNARVTVRIASTDPLTAELITREELQDYWGYRVEVKEAEEVFSDGRFDLRIATSRLGSPLAESLGPLRASVSGARGVKLILGSPSRGLFDMFGKALSGRVQFVLNLYPEQNVETVRTEEAVFAGLGLLSLLSAEKP